MVNFLVKLNKTRSGRDKLIRTFQYSCKFINSFSYLATKSSQRLEKILSSFRMLLRFGTVIDEIITLGNS